MSPSREMPSPYMMSNSASRKGAAVLFFTILTLVREPTTRSPSFMAAMRRMSTRMEEENVGIDAELFGVNRIERVFGVDECRQAAGLLCFGDNLESNGRFAGRLRAEDFDDASAREAADSEGGIERDGAGGDHRHRND